MKVNKAYNIFEITDMYCTAMLINIYCTGIIQLYPGSFIAKYHYQSSCYLKKSYVCIFFH